MASPGSAQYRSGIALGRGAVHAKVGDDRSGGPVLELRLLFLTLALVAVGCTPVLNNPLGSDDDDTTAVDDDDDDTTADDDDDDDDDDDATWGDDDDVVDPTCSDEGATTSWITGPSDVEGTWVAGTITMDADAGSLMLMTEVGVGYTWRLGNDYSALSTLSGQGRVYWSQPGFGAWGGDFVFAVEAFEASFRFVTGLVVGLEEVTISDWGATFSVNRSVCDGLVVEDDCGVFQVLALEYEVSTWDGVAIGTLFPNEGVGSQDFTVEHRYGVGYLEMLCDDVDMTAWSFAMTQYLEVWDG
jgi:hypothetical protein